MTDLLARFAECAFWMGRYMERAENLARGAGTCRDFALLMMEAVRSLGMAARFVSG